MCWDTRYLAGVDRQGLLIVALLLLSFLNGFAGTVLLVGPLLVRLKEEREGGERGGREDDDLRCHVPGRSRRTVLWSKSQ